MRLLLITILSLFTYSCTKPCDDSIIKTGDIIYAYKEGQMQCLSQIDASGKITVLLKSLKNNTEITVSDLCCNDNQEYLLKITMAVKKDTTEFKSWTDIQEVSMFIDPLPVDSITLNGKTVFDSDNIKIIFPE